TGILSTTSVPSGRRPGIVSDVQAVANGRPRLRFHLPTHMLTRAGRPSSHERPSLDALSHARRSGMSKELFGVAAFHPRAHRGQHLVADRVRPFGNLFGGDHLVAVAADERGSVADLNARHI